MAAVFIAFALIATSQLTFCVDLKYSTGVTSTGALIMTGSNGTHSPSHLMRRFGFPANGTLAAGGLLDSQSGTDLPEVGYLAPGCYKSNDNKGIYPVLKTATSVTIGTTVVDAAIRCCKQSTDACTYNTNTENPPSLTTDGQGCFVGNSGTSWDGVGSGQYLRCTGNTLGYLNHVGSGGGVCMGTGKNYYEAFNSCAKLPGYSLCTYAQVIEIMKPVVRGIGNSATNTGSKQLCCGTGCGVDSRMMWIQGAP